MKLHVDPKIVETAARILESDPDKDFYVFRHPDTAVPRDLRHTNAIHRINDVVAPDRLFVVDADVFDLLEEDGGD